jgi:hypothetical protein
MAKENSRLIRVAPEFERELTKIELIKRNDNPNMSKSEFSSRKMTERILKTPSWSKVLEDIKNDSKRDENNFRRIPDFRAKRGQMNVARMFLFMAMIFILVIVTAVILYFVHSLPGVIQPIAIGMNSSSIDSIGAYDDTVGMLNIGYQPVQWAMIAIIFAMVISIFIASGLSREHPVVVVPYFFITVVAVIFSAIFSNVYESYATTSFLSGELNSMAGVSWLFGNLPVVVTVIGFIGMVLVIVNMNRGISQYG